MIIDDGQANISSVRRRPCELRTGMASADKGAVGEPIQAADLRACGGRKLQRFRTDLRGMQLVCRSARRIRYGGVDACRTKGSIAAVIGRQSAPRHARESVQVQDVRRPVFKHL